jgi:hypothetical protein
MPQTINLSVDFLPPFAGGETPGRPCVRTAALEKRVGVSAYRRERLAGLDASIAYLCVPLREV